LRILVGDEIAQHKYFDLLSTGRKLNWGQYISVYAGKNYPKEPQKKQNSPQISPGGAGVGVTETPLARNSNAGRNTDQNKSDYTSYTL
jgi:hypothetical protein